jgi:ribonuclease HI
METLEITKTLNIYCDGGSRGNPGPSASAFVLKDGAGNLREKRGKFLGLATNNEAEYQAVILALEFLVENPICEAGQKKLSINFYLDSKLVASQINGLFKVKNSKIRLLMLRIRELETELIAKCESKSVSSSVVYHQIPREENGLADLAVNEVLDQVSKT